MSEKKPKRNEIWKLKGKDSYLVLVKFVLFNTVFIERDIYGFIASAKVNKKRFLEKFEWEGILEK